MSAISIFKFNLKSVLSNMSAYRYPLVFGTILAVIVVGFTNRSSFVHQGYEDRRQEAFGKAEVLQKKVREELQNVGKG
jgi:hypothetical protein